MNMWQQQGATHGTTTVLSQCWTFEQCVASLGMLSWLRLPRGLALGDKSSIRIARRMMGLGGHSLRTVTSSSLVVVNAIAVCGTESEGLAQPN